MKTTSARVTILASGGIDSTALIDFYLRRKTSIDCIHFQYGQANAISEKKAFENIMKFYGLTGHIIKLGFSLNKRHDEVLGRNTLFVLIASFSGNSNTVALGIHSGTTYYDCSRMFLHDSQRILDGYFAGTVSVEAPFIDLSREEIVSYCKNFKVPLELTYSCQRQNYVPCGICPTCRELASVGEE